MLSVAKRFLVMLIVLQIGFHSSAYASSVQAISVQAASVQAESVVNPPVKTSHSMLYYSKELTARALAPYNLIVLDQEDHALVPPLIDDGKTVLVYLSLDDDEQNLSWFKSMGAKGLISSASQNMSDSFLIDLRDKRWTSHVIENLIPAMLQKGFQGVFLDAFDNPATLERKNPKKNKGMTEAAVQLILAIRRHYPEIKIMINHGYDLLPRIGHAVDVVLDGSPDSDDDYTQKHFDQAEAEILVNTELYLQNFPALKIYNLDGLSVKDKKGFARTYKRQGKKRFVPLVSTVGPDKIVHVSQLKKRRAINGLKME